jgi:hypothetical protein
VCEKESDRERNGVRERKEESGSRINVERE